MFKRILSLLVVFMVLASVTFSVSAADVSGSDFSTEITVSTSYYSSGSYPEFKTTISTPRSNSYSILLTYPNSAGSGIQMGSFSSPISSSAPLFSSGSVGVYFSYFFVAHNSTASFTYLNGSTIGSPAVSAASYTSALSSPSGWIFSAVNSEAIPQSLKDMSNFKFYGVSFSVPSPNSQYSYSVPMRFSLSFDIDYPLYSLSLTPPVFMVRGGLSVPYYLYVPSFSIIATETSADLSALEGIADSIAALDNTMSAMYADIMPVLNSIYQRLGDIDATADLIQQTLVECYKSLQQLNATSTQIYNVLSQYLHYLETIATTTDDILTELQSFHADFIDRLDQIIAALTQEAPDISDPTNGAQDSINQFDALEQSFVTSMTDSFNKIDFGTNFDGGFVDGLSLYTSLFMEFWDALGAYAVLYTIPLGLGIGLLILGRVSRYVSSGGPSEAGTSDGGLRHRGGTNEIRKGRWTGRRG